MSLYLFTTEHWPIVVLTCGETTTDEEQEAMFRDWEKVFARREPYACITDTRKVCDPGTAKSRARVAEWSKSVAPEVKRYSLGHALVVNSALVRGALTAINWVHKTPVPEGSFGTMVEAWDFCLSNLSAGGIVVPAHIVAHRSSLAGAAA
jgi:hypothetical protein